MYKFFGWENVSSVRPLNDNYPFIKSPYDLYDALSEIWCADTCAPRMRNEWSENNKTKGQCSITAFLAQDIFGGDVFGIPLSDGSFHCYNNVGGIIFDLTSEQFGGNAQKLVYSDNPLQLRENHFSKEEKKLRYQYLKNALDSYSKKADTKDSKQ